VWLVIQTPLADMHNAYRAQQKTTKGRIRYNQLQLLHKTNVTDSSNKVRVQIIESRPPGFDRELEPAKPVVATDIRPVNPSYPTTIPAGVLL
jgi:hypothetical protein